MHKFDTSTESAALRAGFCEAIGVAQQTGLGAIERRNQELARRLKIALCDARGVRLHTPLEEATSTGIVTVGVDGMAGGELTQALWERKIVTRPVELFHLHDPIHPESAGDEVPYPRPGAANVKVRLGVVSASGGTPVFVSWDEARFPYLAKVVWKDGPLTLVVL